jgi:hypothetical protein
LFHWYFTSSPKIIDFFITNCQLLIFLSPLPFECCFLCGIGIESINLLFNFSILCGEFLMLIRCKNFSTFGFCWTSISLVFFLLLGSAHRWRMIRRSFKSTKRRIEFKMLYIINEFFFAYLFGVKSESGAGLQVLYLRKRYTVKKDGISLRFHAILTQICIN